MGRAPRLSGRHALIIAVAAFGLASLALLTGCGPELQAELHTYNGINAIRAKHGLPPLQADPGLVQVARIRSRDMAARGYFSHNPPDGCNFVCLMDSNRVGHAWAGENIAWNNWEWSQTAERAVRMWENSPPHMQNILNCHFTKFGTGVAKSADGKIYYTMVFEGDRGC
jgi:uncharacterized protein YkwD